MLIKISFLTDPSLYSCFKVCQEMNYTEKRPDYINPYKKIAQRPELKKEKEISKEHKKKKKLPRGPRLSSQQFGDL